MLKRSQYHINEEIIIIINYKQTEAIYKTANYPYKKPLEQLDFESWTKKVTDEMVCTTSHPLCTPRNLFLMALLLTIRELNHTSKDCKWKRMAQK
jgi:hypothetical protein